MKKFLIISILLTLAVLPVCSETMTNLNTLVGSTQIDYDDPWNEIALTNEAALRVAADAVIQTQVTANSTTGAANTAAIALCWKSDGSSTATGAWNLGTWGITSASYALGSIFTMVEIGGNTLFNQISGDIYFQNADIYMTQSVDISGNLELGAIADVEAAIDDAQADADTANAAAAVNASAIGTNTADVVTAQAAADAATVTGTNAQAIATASLAAATAAQTYAATNRTTRLWSSTTNYVDGNGIMYEIVTIPYSTLTCIDHTALGNQSSWIGETWVENDPIAWPGYYYSENHPNDEEYGTWNIWTEMQRLNNTSIAEDYSYIDLEGNFDPDTTTTITVYEMNYGAEQTTLKNVPAGVYTNIIDRAVTTNGTVIIIGSTTDSSGTTTNLQALAGSSPVSLDFFGAAEAEAAFEPLDSAYTKAEADAKYAPIGTGSSIVSEIDTVASADAIINSATNIYRVSVSTATEIGIDASGLDLSGDNVAQWELWVDFTATNALDSTWASDIDWGGYEPDLTVTGCYKFAMSTIDGTTVTAKQTYPSVYQLTRFPSSTYMSSLAASTDAVTWCHESTPDQLTFIHVYIKSSTVGETYDLVTPAYSKVLQTTQTTVGSFTLTGVSGDAYFIDKFTEADCVSNSSANTSAWGLAKTGSTNTSAPRFWMVSRPANELEIAAYADGWRP